MVTKTNWERNRTHPELRHLPRIIAFLGYDPLPSPTNLAERLEHVRKIRGLTQYQLARMIQVDPTTGAGGRGSLSLSIESKWRCSSHGDTITENDASCGI
jgi:hypothetical protein